MPVATSEVVIIGGGITGAAAAYWLVKAGLSVRLIEKHRLAAMASGWTLGGVRQSGRHPAELPLARAAVAMWGGLAEELGVDVGYRRAGNLRLARTEAEVEHIRKLVETQRALGLDLSYLPTNTEVRAVAPAIGPSILAASFCPTDGHAEPVRAVTAFATAAQRHGALLREGVTVQRIEIDGERVTGVTTSGGAISCRYVVVAAGVHASSLLRPLGLDIPMRAEIVTVLRTEPIAPCFDQVFGVANADCAGRQEIGGALRVTSGVGPWPHAVESWTPQRLMPSAGDLARLIGRVSLVLPVLATTPVESLWGGLIDLTPDALPVIDAPPEIKGLIIAAGFSGHGFALGPVMGPVIADLVQQQAPTEDLAAFKLGRFENAQKPAVELTLHG